jgi:outer membrane protein TolC
MGEDPSNIVAFEDNSISTNLNEKQINDFKNSVGNLQSSINAALKNRIDYSSSQLNKDIAAESINLSKGNYYPTLSANFNYGYIGWNEFEKNNMSGSFGINLNIPIFTNYSTDLNVERSTLNYERENTYLLKLEQNIKAEVQTAYFNLESAEKAIQISQKSYTAARQNFDAIKEKLQGSFGINLNIPLFSNYSTDLSVESSTLNYERENTYLLKLEQNIKAEVQTAYFNLESAEKAIQISQKSYTAARQNFDAIKEKLNVGTATMTDFIIANTQYITAQINVITASYNYLATQKDLLFTIGKY